jgi:DNA (cytosine-5)-methyltransferase 1
MSELLCGSLFSGVGGMDLGFTWAGWRHAFFAEIDPFGRAVLAERFPGVPIYSDVRDVPECERGEWPRLDVLTFGSPCQDLSVAGKRRGLDGDRSGLFWEAMRIAGDGPLRPRALLMENVEGLLSSNGGRDFALVLDAMAERGYRWSYRVLDSQHFAVPQRRRRVFVCAVADDDPRAERIGEVLALAEGGGRDSPTSDPSWPRASSRAGAGAPSGRVIGALTESGGAMTMDHQSFVGGGQYVTPADHKGIVNTLTASYAGVGNTQDEITLAGIEAVLAQGEAEIAPTVTAKWAKGSGGPAGSETGNLIVTRERERERSVVNAITATIQHGADDSTAQAGHLIVEDGQ